MRRKITVLVVAASLQAACLDPQTDLRERASDGVESPCFDCHGDPANGDSAPPPAFWREPDRSDAHRAHLDLGIACATCHNVPTEVHATGHIDTDLPAELVWTGLAVADDAEPTYAAETGTCAGVYCHGGTLESGAGSLTTPDWFVVDGSQAACGTCHGLPPAAPHPANPDCALCHSAVVGPEGDTLNADLHLNGLVEVDELECNSCHGDATGPAPPLDLAGNAETSARGVGAHRAHLAAAGWHAGLACEDCHVVPEALASPGHLDSELPAELTFGALATTDGAEPAFDGARCENVYCHGATLADAAASLTAPIWTAVDGTQAACGTCHGLPPGGLHPPRTACEDCHSAVFGPDGFVAPELHVNGLVELDNLACDACHGFSGDPAPPLDIGGGRATTRPGVGAHQAHLASDALWHAAVACSECHAVPDDTDAAGHRDTALPAELVWGPLATAEGAEPEYDPESGTCSNTYCHGAALLNGAGSLAAPAWDLVDGTQAACGTCHSLPPGAPHPVRTDCQTCHGLVVSAPFRFLDPARHINGVVDLGQPE